MPTLKKTVTSAGAQINDLRSKALRIAETLAQLDLNDANPPDRNAPEDGYYTANLETFARQQQVVLDVLRRTDHDTLYPVPRNWGDTDVRPATESDHS